MVSESFCRICGENLRTKYETCVATVPLFFWNKEYCNVLCEKPVILAQLLLGLKIFFSHDSSSSVCKKCAGKIVNCFKLFVESEKAFAVGSAVKSGKGKHSTNSYERTVFRSTPAIPNWSHSEGQAYCIKESMFGDTAQESERTPLSKQSLYFDKYSVVEDEIIYHQFRRWVRSQKSLLNFYIFLD